MATTDESLRAELEDTVSLNVGGTVLVTTKATLRRHPGSGLACMVAEGSTRLAAHCRRTLHGRRESTHIRDGA